MTPARAAAFIAMPTMEPAGQRSIWPALTLTPPCCAAVSYTHLFDIDVIGVVIVGSTFCAVVRFFQVYGIDCFAVIVFLNVVVADLGPLLDDVHRSLGNGVFAVFLQGNGPSGFSFIREVSFFGDNFYFIYAILFYNGVRINHFVTGLFDGNGQMLCNIVIGQHAGIVVFIHDGVIVDSAGLIGGSILFAAQRCV